MALLSEMEKSALAEIGNISMGSAATALSYLLNQRVNITAPQISQSTLDDIMSKYPIPCVVVEVEYSKGLEGKNILIIERNDAAIIANLMMGLDPESEVEELDEIQTSAVSEAMNQMMGSTSTAMAELFNMLIDISPPKTEYLKAKEMEEETREMFGDPLIQIQFRIEVGNLIDSNLILLLGEDFAKGLATRLLKSFEIEAGGEEPVGEEPREAETSAEEKEALLEKEEEVIPEDLPEEGVPVEPQPAVAAKIDELGLDEMESDALREVGNISMGSGATALSLLLNQPVSITTPTLKITTFREVWDSYPVPSVLIKIQYQEGLEGENLLVVKEEDAKIVASLMMGGDTGDLPPGIDEIQLSAVSEAMNQMMGSSSTAMADMFNFTVNISPPETLYRQEEERVPEAEIVDLDTKLVQVSFRLVIGEEIDSEILQLVPLGFAKKMASHLLQGFYEEEEGVPAGEGVEGVVAPETGVEGTEEGAREQPQAPAEAPPAPVPPPARPREKAPPAAAQEKPPLLQEEEAPQTIGDSLSEDERLELIRDIPVTMSGVLGRRLLKIKEVAGLNPGDILELDRSQGDAVDVLANGKLVARGEIVVIEDQFGLRITEILVPEVRL